MGGRSNLRGHLLGDVRRRPRQPEVAARDGLLDDRVVVVLLLRRRRRLQLVAALGHRRLPAHRHHVADLEARGGRVLGLHDGDWRIAGRRGCSGERNNRRHSRTGRSGHVASERADGANIGRLTQHSERNGGKSTGGDAISTWISAERRRRTGRGQSSTAYEGEIDKIWARGENCAKFDRELLEQEKSGAKREAEKTRRRKKVLPKNTFHEDRTRRDNLKRYVRIRSVETKSKVKFPFSK